jgi:hypothetical protein
VSIRCKRACLYWGSKGTKMAGRVIRLGPGECSDIETGARYFAALAFPGVAEYAARQDAAAAWVGSYLHEANRIDGSDDPFADQRLNEFIRHPAKWCRGKLRTTRRRLRDRSHAARAVRPWVRDLLDHPQQPVPGVRKFTQRQIALYLCSNNPEHADNFQKRIWRPARPIIHYLAAQDLLLSAVEGEQMVFKNDLASTDLIPGILDKAGSLGPLICGDKRFGVAEDDLLQMHWVA